MASQIVLLLVGFVLTSVLGGLLGYYFQRRTWDSNRRESERSAAAAVFDDVSRKMDERLYRMRLLYWSLKAGDDGRTDEAMRDYRAALVTWNDNLNRNLALAQRYFGEQVWVSLSGVIYEEFAIIGRHLEAVYRHRRTQVPAQVEDDRLSLTGRRLVALGNDIFELNRQMISMIQRGKVGLYLEPANDSTHENARGALSVGARSARVADWQRKLVRLGYGPLDVDAWFGEATRAATAAFQGASGLKPDGIVDDLTQSKMDEALAAEPQATPGRSGA